MGKQQAVVLKPPLSTDLPETAIIDDKVYTATKVYVDRLIVKISTDDRIPVEYFVKGKSIPSLKKSLNKRLPPPGKVYQLSAYLYGTNGKLVATTTIPFPSTGTLIPNMFCNLNMVKHFVRHNIG